MLIQKLMSGRLSRKPILPIRRGRFRWTIFSTSPVKVFVSVLLLLNFTVMITEARDFLYGSDNIQRPARSNTLDWYGAMSIGTKLLSFLERELYSPLKLLGFILQLSSEQCLDPSFRISKENSSNISFESARSFNFGSTSFGFERVGQSNLTQHAIEATKATLDTNKSQALDSKKSNKINTFQMIFSNLAFLMSIFVFIALIVKEKRETAEHDSQVRENRAKTGVITPNRPKGGTLERLGRFCNRIYAFFFNHSWISCPRCGRMFGGHESGKDLGVHHYNPDGSEGWWICCKFCDSKNKKS